LVPISPPISLSSAARSRPPIAAHQATRPAPLRTITRHGTLFNSAPPTQGAASLLILALLDRLAAGDVDSFEHVHALVEATKQAFLWRDRHCGDVAYMEDDPQALLDNAAALDAMAARVDPPTPCPGRNRRSGATPAGSAPPMPRDKSSRASSRPISEFGSGWSCRDPASLGRIGGASFRLAPSGWNAR
jgi:gamma-glutamyltranspeptidase/glutathione hydrolase